MAVVYIFAALLVGIGIGYFFKTRITAEADKEAAALKGSAAATVESIAKKL